MSQVGASQFVHNSRGGRRRPGVGAKGCAWKFSHRFSFFSTQEAGLWGESRSWGFADLGDLDSVRRGRGRVLGAVPASSGGWLDMQTLRPCWISLCVLTRSLGELGRHVTVREVWSGIGGRADYTHGPKPTPHSLFKSVYVPSVAAFDLQWLSWVWL